MRRVALILLVGFVFAAGCRKDTVTSPSAEGLVGTWRATKAEYVSKVTSGLSYEVVGRGGSVTLALTSSQFTYTLVKSGSSAQVTTGTWTSTLDLLTLNPSGVSFSVAFEMNQSGNNLTLNGGSMEFDFSGTGTPENATVNLTLVRQ